MYSALALREEGFDDDYIEDPRPRKELGCTDGKCGALDCPKCHPENTEE